jgi:hypothetical protein
MDVGKQLEALTKLNASVLATLTKASSMKGGEGGKKDAFQFKTGPEKVVVQDFDKPALEKLKSISGARVAPSAEASTSGKSKGLGSALGMILGLGVGIAGLAVVFSAADKAIGALGGGESLASLMKNLAEGLGSFAGPALVPLGALLGAGALFGMLPGGGFGIKRGVKLATGIAGIGVGLAGFMLGLAGSDKLISMLGESDPGASIATLMSNLATGLGAFDNSSMIALGSLLGAGALFGNIPGLSVQGAALGMTAIGAGIGGFILGIGAGDKLMDLMMGESEPGKAISTLMQNIAEGLGAFSGAGLAALGGLMAAGAIFGAVPGGLAVAGAAALGMTAIGAALGGFFVGLGAMDKILDMMAGDSSPGSSLRDLMVNIASGFGSMADKVAKYSMADFGKITTAATAVAAALGVSGLGGLSNAVLGALTDVVNFFRGKKDEDPLQFMYDIAARSEVLGTAGDGIKKIVDGLNYFTNLSTEDSGLDKFGDKFFMTATKIVKASQLMKIALFGGEAKIPFSTSLEVEMGLATDEFAEASSIAANNIQKIAESVPEISITMDDKAMALQEANNASLQSLSNKADETNTILNKILVDNSNGNQGIINALGTISFNPLGSNPGAVESNVSRSSIRDIQANALGYA